MVKEDKGRLDDGDLICRVKGPRDGSEGGDAKYTEWEWEAGLEATVNFQSPVPF